MKWFIGSAAPRHGPWPRRRQTRDAAESGAYGSIDRSSRRVEAGVQRVWRIERDFFYDPNLHGLNLPATRKQYEPYLENIGAALISVTCWRRCW